MDLGNFRVKPVWPKSKEDIWAEKFEHLDEQSDSRRCSNRTAGYADVRQGYPVTFLRRIPLWGYAASLLIPILLFCHFYMVTETAKRGEQTVVQLPDRSTVTLNAESKLSYKPVSWFISSISHASILSRNVRLEGEAFFEVIPGNRFSVHTGDKRVSVLGTSFNVQARTGVYRVTCLTGQVEVRTAQETALLNPNMQATLHENKLKINSDITPSLATAWMQGKFVFVETPLQEVVAEVERQYNIQVTPVTYPNHLFSGNFSKTEKLEDILEIIGKPFDITFLVK